MFANAAQPGEVARLAVYRCYNGHQHFIRYQLALRMSPNHGSSKSDCGGATTESLLGWASAEPRGGTPRSLIACRNPSGLRYHSLDWPCDAGDETTDEFGYVH